MLLEIVLSRTLPSSTLKKQINVLSRVVISSLERLRKPTETEFEVRLKKEKLGDAFQELYRSAAEFLRLKKCAVLDKELAEITLGKGAQLVLKTRSMVERGRFVCWRRQLRGEDKYEVRKRQLGR